MWKRLPKNERDKHLPMAIEFTGNAELYGAWMLKVVESWPIACEHNLTDFSINQRAWIGHAACTMAISCPENVTRQAWWFLSEKQRIDANSKADIAILEWNRKHDLNKKQMELF